jgi:superfamily I DNA and RNA helicase
MVRENKKTMLRTIRLSKSLDDLLQKDANSKRITVGALISTILTKYSQWDRYTEKFDTITFGHETLRAILEATEDEALIRKAREIGAKIPKEFLMFWFKRTDLESYLRYLELLCNYGGFARHELEVDNGSYVITLLHNMGEKWSLFLKHHMEEGIMSTIGTLPRFEVNKGSLIIKIAMP